MRHAAQLQALRDVDGTLIFFESSHRIKGLLQRLRQSFPRQRCVIARELTKLHEQFLFGEPAELLDRLEQDNSLTRGEFVVLIDNANAVDKRRAEGDELAILRILLDEVPLKQAASIAAGLTGGKKNDLYQLAVQLRGKQDSN